MPIGIGKLLYNHRVFPLKWITEPGSLGTFEEKTPFSFQLKAQTARGSIANFVLVSGKLPSGLTLASDTGVISGDLPDLDENEVFNFSVKVTDTNGITLVGQFSIAVNGIAEGVRWITPAGDVVDNGVGAPVFVILEAKSAGT